MLSLIVLAKVCVEQNAWTLSGKRTSANFFSFRRNGSAFITYLLILSCRVILFSIPLTYLRWAMLILPILMLSLNICTIQCTHLLGRDKGKNALTAITGTFIPIGFVAKREIQNMGSPELRLAKFCLYNNIHFTFVSLMALVATNLILHFDILTSFYMNACAGMLFSTCHQTWSDSLNGGKYSNHVAFFFYGNVFLIIILLLHISLSFYFSRNCYNKFYHTN